MIYGTQGASLQGDQDTQMPWRNNTSSDKTLQLFVGNYFIDNFVYALLTSNPDLVIYIT